MTSWIKQNFTLVEWLVGGAVSMLALLIWIDERNIGGSKLGVYELFPVLGLLAFGLMWSHYALGSLRRLVGREKKSGRDSYWIVSSGLVLALIVLHPLLLNIGLVRDGAGLPPLSYQAAYGADAIYLMLGTIGLFIFLSFELHRWFRNKSWWRYVEWAQMLGMILIFIHGTSLGREINMSWYQFVWWTLGLTLVLSWVYNWKYDKAQMPRGKHGIK